MQRVSQMGIVPDLLGMLAPQADVRICLNGGYVEPGSFVPALANVSNILGFGG